MFSDRRLLSALTLPLWLFLAGAWKVLNVAMPVRLCRSKFARWFSRLEYDMTAAFWSSFRSAAWTFSEFFTGRDLFLELDNVMLKFRTTDVGGEVGDVSKDSPMKEHDENEDQENDDDGGGDRDARSEVALVLSVVHSHWKFEKVDRKVRRKFDESFFTFTTRFIAAPLPVLHALPQVRPDAVVLRNAMILRRPAVRCDIVHDDDAAVLDVVRPFAVDCCEARKNSSWKPSKHPLNDLRLQTGFLPAHSPLGRQCRVLFPTKYLPFVHENFAVSPTSRLAASTIRCSFTSGIAQVISTHTGVSCPQVPSSEHNRRDTPSSLNLSKHSYKAAAP